MPGRKIPLVSGEIYHIYNRGTNRQPTFTNKWEYKRALLALRFYRFISPPVRLSVLLSTSKENQQEVLGSLEKSGEMLADTLSYCLMTNHFHLLLRQKEEKGISKFMSNFQNSYTKFFNTRNGRDGALFSDQFKAVRVETEDQLLHVHRYIHLNPYSSYVVSKIKDLINYPWSSISEYLDKNTQNICETKTVLSYFKDIVAYKKFIFNQADYQRNLERIKHLAIE